MNLKYSHVDILVSDLNKTIEYYRGLFDCKVSHVQTWKHDDFHVEFVILFLLPTKERIFFVHPFSGNLKEMLDEKGDGTIYRLCYTSPDVVGCHYEFLSKGVQPENENGEPIHASDLNIPGKTNILWLPKEIGSLSIEILEEAAFETKLAALYEKAT